MMRKAFVLLCLCVLLLLPFSPAAADYATLIQGASGAEVTELKTRMYELGYFSSLSFSDTYNGLTSDRVKQLQKVNGLAQTGQVTPELWTLIFSAECLKKNGTPIGSAKASSRDGAAQPQEAQAQEPAQDPHAPIPVSGAPERDEEGFLLSGQEEYVLKDKTGGLWVYLSQTLQVVIQRRQDTANKIIWYETDIRTAAGEVLRSLSAGGGYKYPYAIARANQAVVAFSDDYYMYRKNQGEPVGIVIRNGEVISSRTKKPTAGGFPKLENLAYFPDDGRMQCFNALEHTAEEYLQMGASQVMAFGPILVTGGALGEHMTDASYYHYKEPRCALGMVQPGHYVVLTVNGRQTASKGVYLDWLANKMLSLGVQEALNLDGGMTAALVFMGETLNVKSTTARQTKSIMGFGVSTQVPTK